jgi:hypothetical protein
MDSGNDKTENKRVYLLKTVNEAGLVTGNIYFYKTYIYGCYLVINDYDEA